MDNMVFEVGVALILIAIVSAIAGKFKLSIIPFLIVLGMVVGPHAPTIGMFDFTFIESQSLIDFLGRMGILFLLFYLGLEFSVSNLIKSGRDIVFGGSVYVVLNFLLGLGFGFVVDLPLNETLIIAGMLSVSSTAIVAKTIVDLRRTANTETELILGMILFDDIFLAVFLSVMSGILLGGATTIGGLLLSISIAIGYMLMFFAIARVGTPFLNKVLNITSNEIFIIVVFAALFFISGFSEKLHVAEAIGALLFGLALSETEHAKRIEHLVVPFRDFFGAIFFFSFGLSIDPLTLTDAVWLALGAVVLTIIGNIVAGMIAGRKKGLSHKASLNIGLTIMARGEFSIIIANLGIAAGLAPMLKPFSALYVLILAILGPILAKDSKRIYGGLNKIFKWTKPKEKVSNQQ